LVPGLEISFGKVWNIAKEWGYYVWDRGKNRRYRAGVKSLPVPNGLLCYTYPGSKVVELE
jgi:hypothetical protein